MLSVFTVTRAAGIFLFSGQAAVIIILCHHCPVIDLTLGQEESLINKYKSINSTKIQRTVFLEAQVGTAAIERQFECLLFLCERSRTCLKDLALIRAHRDSFH